MSENPTRRQFSAEFKRDAVDLTQQPGPTSTDVAHQLGIRPALLRRWRQKARARGELAFPGAGKQALSEEQQQIRQLQKQLREAEMDREILKKALAIFSQTP